MRRMITYSLYALCFVLVMLSLGPWVCAYQLYQLRHDYRAAVRKDALHAMRHELKLTGAMPTTAIPAPPRMPPGW